MIILSCDHAGYELMQQIKAFFEKEKIEYKYMGPTEYNNEDDYPDFAIPACKEILKDEGNWGILACGTGIGMSMVANKYKGIRAVVAYDLPTAYIARAHNNANVLCLGGRVQKYRTNLKIIKMFLKTEFENAERHNRRLAKYN